MIGSSSPDLIKRPDTSARLYSAVVNSGGVTAEVLGEPLVPFHRGEGIVYCEKPKPEISSLERVSMVV